jgi:hypothetical protein
LGPRPGSYVWRRQKFLGPAWIPTPDHLALSIVTILAELSELLIFTTFEWGGPGNVISSSRKISIHCPTTECFELTFNPLNAELNPICHLLALLGAHPIFHISRIKVKNHASYIEDGPTATLQMLHFIYIFNKCKYRAF